MKTKQISDNLTVSHFSDGSTLLEAYSSGERIGVPLLRTQHEKLVEFLCPKSERKTTLYVVKSATGCYATYASIDGEHLGYCTVLTWTEGRSKAAHFTTKEAARSLAKGCCPAAGARVVKVKS